MAYCEDGEGITIEKSADQMDEIQFATERDLAIETVDRETSLLCDAKDAVLRRIHDGSFGTCIDCEWRISPSALAAVPGGMLYSVPGRCRARAAGGTGNSHCNSPQRGLSIGAR